MLTTAPPDLPVTPDADRPMPPATGRDPALPANPHPPPSAGTAPTTTHRRRWRGAAMLALAAVLAVVLAGCSAGRQGLLSITPQQYFYSAKETFETIDERTYEERDLDEVIRVLTNAEKDAKKAEIIDKSRMYLVLLLTLKARRQFQTQRITGKFVGGRPEPLYELDVKPIRETLRQAKKWLRMCRANFKTTSVAADLDYVEGMYYTQKMLTQSGGEREESFWNAVSALRHCLARAPAYQSDFRLFGRLHGPRDVRLQLIETLALGGEVTEAYELVTEYAFSPTFPREDLPWLHRKGLVLALMGRYREAIETLGHFKIVAPQDYPPVDAALWLLEGVYAALAKETGDRNVEIEGKIVAAQLGELKGPFSKAQAHSAATLFPRWSVNDREVFAAHAMFVEGKYQQAGRHLAPVLRRGLLSHRIRQRAEVLALEAAIYGGEAMIDTVLEQVLRLALTPNLSMLQRERIGQILARYLIDNDANFARGRLHGEHQAFARAWMGQPRLLSLGFERPQKPKEADKPKERPGRRQRGDRNEDARREAEERRKAEGPDQKSEGESASLFGEVAVNRADDWVVSAKLTLVELPRMTLIGKGQLVGREESEGGLLWRFKGSDIDELHRGGHYLAVIEFTNSDNDVTWQGTLLSY